MQSLTSVRLECSGERQVAPGRHCQPAAHGCHLEPTHVSQMVFRHEHFPGFLGFRLQDWWPLILGDLVAKKVLAQPRSVQVSGLSSSSLPSCEADSCSQLTSAPMPELRLVAWGS